MIVFGVFQTFRIRFNANPTHDGRETQKTKTFQITVADYKFTTLIISSSYYLLCYEIYEYPTTFASQEFVKVIDKGSFWRNQY